MESVSWEQLRKEIKMFANRLFILFLTIAVLVPIAITGMGLAVSPHTEASGSFSTTSTTIHRVTEDKFNEVIDLSSTVTYTGAIEGTSTVDGTLTVRRDGSGNFQGLETFNGFVNGIPGALRFKLAGTMDVYQEMQLTSTITSGTGELASLRGVISKTGITKDNGPVGTYIWHIDQD
jgi:hypothetical protein